jgi:Spy/CpxP family protein refolding chaperone
MKKIVLATLLVVGVGLFGADIEAQKVEKNSQNNVQDLVNIPFPGGKMFKSGKISLSDEQKTKFDTEIHPIMHEKYKSKIQEVFKLKKEIERSIKKETLVVDETLKEKLNTMAKLNAEATTDKLEALLKIKAILTSEQWQIWVNN